MPRVAKAEFAEAVLGEVKRVQMGQASALIDDVSPAQEVIMRMFEEAIEAAGSAFRAVNAVGGRRP
jgi:hypothetical protein